MGLGANIKAKFIGDRGHSRDRIRPRVLIPFTLVLVFVIGAFLTTAYRDIKWEHERDLSESVDAVEELFDEELERDSLMMRSALGAIIRNEELKAAFLAGDREALYQLALPLFREFREDYDITHFYFIGLDRVNFLRVHRPDRHGDVIDRGTTLRAEKSGEVASGVELGPLGTLTLRVVMPWRDGGRVIGFVELGHEMGHAAEEIHRILDVDLLVLVYKKHLDRKDWEEGMRLKGRLGDWDRFPTIVVVDRTIEKIPQGVIKLLEMRRHPHMPEMSIFEAEEGEKTLIATILPVFERFGREGEEFSPGREVGDFVIVLDTSEIRAAFRNSIFLTVAVSLLAGGVVFVVFYVILGRVERDVWGTHQHLEEHVQERTKELSEEIAERKRVEAELLVAKEEAENASAAKTRFLAAASHDLRQPLMAMNLFVDLLARNPRDAEQLELIDSIENTTTTLENLLNRLLDISKLDAGLITPEKSYFSIRLILERLADEFAPQVREKGLEFRMVPCSRLVNSDPVLLEPVLRNLLSNALNYTEKGRILLGCRSDGGNLRIQVWDTGIGIPEDKMAMIFEEFSRLSHPSRKRLKGFGLGLAIVQRMAQLLDHPVRVSSTPGKGTVFEVIVPSKAAAPAPAPGKTGRERRTAPAPAAVTARKLIVVIEDDAAVLNGLRMAIGKWGHEVIAATSSKDALAELRKREQPPDIILADYGLEEGETGTEAILSIRRELGVTVPGLLLTGEITPARLKEMRNSGFPVIHKPVKFPELRSALEKLMAEKSPP